MSHDLHDPTQPPAASGTAPEERPATPAEGPERDPRDAEEPNPGADESVTPDPSQGNEQEAEDIARKIAEIERKVADGN